jgi:hypothetical protein
MSGPRWVHRLAGGRLACGVAGRGLVAVRFWVEVPPLMSTEARPCFACWGPRCL